MTPEPRHVELEPASAIRSERVRWLWPDRIPLRGLTVIAGEKGLGKSILSNAWLAAKLTSGDLNGEVGSPVDVLIASAEDDWSSVIKPRLMAHGAAVERVHRVKVMDESGEALLTLPDDVSLLEREIERLRAAERVVGMVVVDPIGAFLSTDTDSHKDSPVRRALAPLAALAERCDLAVVVVAHLTKDESQRLFQRVCGSGAFVNAARSVLAFARHPDDAEGEQGRERVLAHVASNWGRYAASLAAHIESRLVDVDDGSQADVGYLLMKGETSVAIEDLQRGPDENASDAEEAITAAVMDGPRSSREVKIQVAEELGCIRKTVERAAMRMKQAGTLAIEAGGYPRTTTWGLVHPPSDDERSGDRAAVGTSPTAIGVPTDAAAVGTSPTAIRVPTDRRDIPTEDSPASGDSGDGAAESDAGDAELATPEEEATVARLLALDDGEASP